MAIQGIAYRIEGTSPLLLHNGHLADPLNAFVKEMKQINSKGVRKTEADVLELARLEFLGSLYVNEKQQLILPADCWLATIVGGAKKSRKGTAFTAAVFVEDDPLLDIGEKDTSPDALWANGSYRDTRGVKIKKSRIMRTRPRFNQWKCTLEIGFDDEQINRGDIDTAIAHAGMSVGIGDYRPRFGRFEATPI